MRLKSLEIKGFKSFADKTILSFDEGITGIIGPNGCGKSNIIDSIRWVIGEQKISALRSENQSALVFNGSKNRSASGLAEVSLTFENTRNLLPTEFSTVTVTRRFFKNGDSEYKLNDVSCRLKDIHNLFLDTGISTDSYAIIELGMVDDIIRDKDNSRRRMLEQAAGITIYKTRKKEAKQKLDATEQDLSRIEDLLFEISNQLKILENQAKKAEKYLDLKKEYKEVAIELAKATLEGFNVTFKQITEQQEAEQDKKARLDAEIAQEEAAIEKEKLNLIEREKELHQQQAAFNELQQGLKSKENDKNLAAQKLNYLKEKETGLKDFLSKAEGQLKNLKDSIQYTQLQVTDENKSLEGLQKVVSNAKQTIEEKRKVSNDKRTSLDALRTLYQNNQRLQFDAEKKVAIADTSINNLQRSTTQLQEEQKNRDVLLKQLERELVEKEALVTNKRKELKELVEIHEFAKQNIFSSQQEVEGLRNKLSEENRKLDSKRNEFALLKSLVDSMEGYPESIKFLHKNQNWNHAAPILSDIIYVNEGYRTAVENVLLPYLNYYVVNNIAEGMAAIQLLDTHKKGKANFFILDKIKAISTSSQPIHTIKALEVIEVDQVYQPLADYLLGNVFIAENESAFKDLQTDGIVLEKSGKYVVGQYTLTGGSVGLFEGKKIGRAKNLEKLKEEINSQDVIVNTLKGEIKTAHDKVLSFNQQLKDGAIRQTENEINQLTNQVFATKNKIENTQASALTAKQRIEDLEKRLIDEQSLIAISRESLGLLNKQLQETSSNLQSSEQAFKAADQELQGANSIYNENNLQLTRVQSRANALQQELNFKQKQLTDLHQQIENNTKQLADVLTHLNDGKQTLLIIENTLVSLIKAKDEEEKKLHEADQAYYNLRNNLQVKETNLKQKLKSKELLDSLLNELKDKINELKLQLAGMKERLNVEFSVDLNAILEEERTTQTSVIELQTLSDKLRKRIENLGEINTTAVEAFTEMKKRFDFITEQKNDLVTAKDSLLQTIQEVETTANQLFLDTFNKVRENFQKVFKALFTEEDTADMVLINPENLSETGVEIIAKPKGKRPSSITQLSGGEKTLTATALLFAIYLIKPAPFCILDEVDAPLDDANVGKFTQMIKKFSDNSQFIIVTHNKQTMGAVDVIYGVTMQEPGVSKLVPVDFRSLN